MEALKIIQELFAWTSVFPSVEKLSASMKLLRTMYTIFIVPLNITAIIASIVFVIKLETADLETILYGFYQIVTFVAGTYMLLTAILLRQKIQDLFLSFHQMHEESKLPNYICILLIVYVTTDPMIHQYLFNSFIDLGNSHYMSCYTAADQFAKRFTFILKLLMIDGCPGVILLAAGISVLYSSITQDQIVVDRLFLPFVFT